MWFEIIRQVVLKALTGKRQTELLTGNDHLFYDFVSASGVNSFILVIPKREVFHPRETTMHSY